MTNWEWLLEMGKERPDELAAWFSATRGGVDAPKEEDGGNDEFPPENVVSVAEMARNANKAAQVVPEEHVRDSTETMPDSREKLEADVFAAIKRAVGNGSLIGFGIINGWLDRQAAITRRTEQAEWIKQANGLIHEANVRAAELEAKVDELAELNDYHSLQYDLAYEDAERLQVQVDNLTDEIAKRDKGIARLKRQRDEAREAISKYEDCDECQKQLDKMLDAAIEERDEKVSLLETAFDRVKELESERNALQAENMSLKANSDECVPKAIKKRDEVIKILKAERDEADATCMGQRREIEELREKLGAAIGHALEITRLQDLEVS